MSYPDLHLAPLAVGLSGSPGGERSRSRLLLDRSLDGLAHAGFAVERFDLSDLSATALLGRIHDASVARALEAVTAARVVIAATPVYRATYSGLLKVFFDLLPPDALAGKVAIPIATGGSQAHQLALDHGLRPLFASVGALVVPSGVYGAESQFAGGEPDAGLLERVGRAVAEAVVLARAIADGTPIPRTNGHVRPATIHPLTTSASLER